MRLIVVCGFLGSGKTSLILGLGRVLARDRGCSVAIIENEINAGGVDGQVLSRSGLTVRELSAGCVCCSLRTDLATTLRALHDEVHPDVVIIEPSGVAGPGLVIEAVSGVIPEVVQPQVIGLIDATRLSMLIDINPFLVESLMAVASVVVLNKCDVVDAKTLIRHEQTLGEIDARPVVLKLSCAQESHARAVLDALEAPIVEMPRQHGDQQHAVSAAAVARQWQWTRTTPMDEHGWRARIEGMLRRIAADMPHNVGLLGHLKVIATTDDGRWISASLTRLETGVTFRSSEWHGATATIQVTLNAIAMGMSRDHFATLIDERIGAGVIDLSERIRLAPC